MYRYITPVCLPQPPSHRDRRRESRDRGSHVAAPLDQLRLKPLLHPVPPPAPPPPSAALPCSSTSIPLRLLKLFSEKTRLMRKEERRGAGAGGSGRGGTGGAGGGCGGEATPAARGNVGGGGERTRERRE
jgi:hypothetical protein